MNKYTKERIKELAILAIFGFCAGAMSAWVMLHI